MDIQIAKKLSGSTHISSILMGLSIHFRVPRSIEPSNKWANSAQLLQLPAAEPIADIPRQENPLWCPRLHPPRRQDRT